MLNKKIKFSIVSFLLIMYGTAFAFRAPSSSSFQPGQSRFLVPTPMETALRTMFVSWDETDFEAIPINVLELKDVYADIVIASNKRDEEGNLKTQCVGGVFLDEDTIVVHDPFLELDTDKKGQERKYSMLINTPENNLIQIYASVKKVFAPDLLVFLTPLHSRAPVKKEGSQCLWTGTFTSRDTVQIKDSTAFIVRDDQKVLEPDTAYKVSVMKHEDATDVWVNSQIKEIIPEEDLIELQLEKPLPAPVRTRVPICTQPIHKDQALYVIEQLTLNELEREDRPEPFPWTFFTAKVDRPLTASKLRIYNVMTMLPDTPYDHQRAIRTSCPVFNEDAQLVGLSMTPYPYPGNLENIVDVIPSDLIQERYEQVRQGIYPQCKKIDALADVFVSETTLEINAIPTSVIVIEGFEDNEFSDPNETTQEEYPSLKGKIIWAINGRVIGTDLDILREEARNNDTVRLELLQATSQGYTSEILESTTSF